MLLVALAVLGTTFQRHDGGAVAFPPELAAFTGLACLACLLYLAAVAIVLKEPLPRGILWAILALAVAMRLPPLLSPSFLSSDLYRYVWDGRVQGAGINPYRFLPADPQLAFLRDATIYPGISRPDYAPTIYPPMAQAIFLLVTQVSATLGGMKAAMALLDLATIAILVRLLARAGLPRERVLIYAWHPLPVWEFAGNAHVDAAAITFIALALLACSHRRPALVGLALGCAALVKLLPIVLAPALWRRWDWRLPAALAATILLGYLPYLGAGTGVLGFLPGYLHEEGLRSGAGYLPVLLLQRLVAVPPLVATVYVAGGLVLLALLALLVAFRPRAREPATAPCRDGLLLATVLMVLMTPHYPWYFAWLIPFCCFVPSPAVLALTVLTFLIYLDFYDPGKYGQVAMYVTFLVLLLAERWRGPSATTPQPAALAGERS